MKRLPNILFSYLHHYWPLMVIIFVETVLFITNYKPQTFLIGWDNLYPELNPILNIQRSFLAVWQEYRNLGYLDGMSQAANLFQDIFRYVLSLVFPTSLVRWIIVFLLHLIGGIGMYILMEYYILQRITQKNISKLIALFGALFYQYNFITVQQFFLPFELFLFHYAFIPLLTYFALVFIDTGKKKHLVWFSLASFLSIPQAHVPTIFIVYILLLSLLMLTKVILSKGKNVKRILLLCLVTFTINCYWGLPFLYGTIQNASIIAHSKNNEMATYDIFYRNLKFGQFHDVATLKGIILDYWQYNVQLNKSGYMMQPWRSYLQSYWFIIPSWIFFLITSCGLVLTIIKRKVIFFPFVTLFIFSFTMMANDTPVLSFFSWLFRTYVPLFSDIFRFVFTKFSFFYVFAYTIFLAIGISYLIEYVKKYVSKILIISILLLGLLIYTLPSFNKHFFYENLSATMPKAYPNLFNFFNTQEAANRIAILPLTSYWAWTQNNWDTIGSGFMWYGLPQATTDRAFDPWSDKNENFYWELDQAIYSENINQLVSVFDKYDINWVVIDKSIYTSSGKNFILPQYEELLQKSKRFTLIKNFDFIQVYRFKTSVDTKNFVSIKTPLPNILPSYANDNDDSAYNQFGDYMTANKSPENIYYPFRSLFSNKRPSEIPFGIENTTEDIAITTHINKKLIGKILHIPSLFQEEFHIFNPNEPSKQSSYSATILLDDAPLVSLPQTLNPTSVVIPPFSKGNLKISFKKNQNIVYNSEADPQFLLKENNICSKSISGLAEKKIVPQGIQLNSQSSNNCINVDLLGLSERYGYLLHIKTLNSSIRGFEFNVVNSGTKNSDLDTYLDHDGKEKDYYFVMPPRNPYGIGYTIIFNNISFGQEYISNILEKSAAYQIPYSLIKNIFITESTQVFPAKNSEPKHITFNATQKNFFTYLVTLPDKKLLPSLTLYLSQSYNKEWHIYAVPQHTSWLISVFSHNFPFMFGQEVPATHTMINNWANGWLIHEKDIPIHKDIIIMYIPQYLEFFGFLVLFLTLVVMFTYRRKSKHI